MSLMWEEIMEQPESLKRCINSNYDKIDRFAKQLREKETDLICIAARGTSDHAGIFGKYIFETVNGIPVSLSAPSVYTIYGKELKLRNTLFIGISQSGRAEDVLEVMRQAQKQGCSTIGITNDCSSPIAKEAACHFDCEAGPEKSVAATKTFTAQLLILSMLAAAIKGDTAFMEKILKLPSLAAAALLPVEELEDKVKRYRYMNECFVLSRGINYPIALETALKIQETSYVRARGYAVSDFYHGPLAMVEKDMPVIVIAPKGPAKQQVREMISRLDRIGAEIIAITNDEEICKRANTCFRVPDEDNDAITAFMNIIITQQIACRLAGTKGINPDKPRELNKITITR